MRLGNNSEYHLYFLHSFVTGQRTPKEYMLRVIQGERSVFKMKSGLKPILVKNPKSNAYLDFIYTKKKSSSSSSNVDTSGIELLEFPVFDLDMYLNNLASSPLQEPLASTINTFIGVVTKWNTKLSNDLVDIWEVPDADTALAYIKYHYHQAGPAMATVQAIVSAIKADASLDQSIGTSLETVSKDMKVAYDMLDAQVKTTRATKEFSYVAAHFNSSVCLYSPCLHDVNITMYPFKYDLGLGALCSDFTKGNFDIWQTLGRIKYAQKAGSFFHFERDDLLRMCITIDGVKNAKVQAGIDLFGKIHKEDFLIAGNKIQIGSRKIKLFGKYDFTINSTVNLELKAWDKASIKTYGVSTPSSAIKTDLQTALNSYTWSEYKRLHKRTSEFNNVEVSLHGSIAQYQEAKRTNESDVKTYQKELVDKEKKYIFSQNVAQKYRKLYDEKKKEMFNLEKEMNKNCTIKRCPRSCNKLPRCQVCQDPYEIPVEVPSCKQVIEDRSYGFEKSEKTQCSHVVTDWKVKYTGNCEKPAPDEVQAKAVIERINGKLERNESLTLEDAIDLENINEEKGRQLREQIEKQRFFKFLPYRLQNLLLSEKDFLKVEEYTKNKTFADELRRKMVDLRNGQILQKMVQKMQDGQKLTEEDFAELRKINKTLEVKIRKSEIVSDIMEKIRLLGNITQDDLSKLKEIAPEYAKNLTAVFEKQDVAKRMVDGIMRKMSNGTLSPKDLSELEKINPGVAQKLKAALKEQLKQKVAEMQKKLKSVKGSLEVGLNGTGFGELQKQLNSLSGSLKNYDREELEKLQKKIRSNNQTSGNVFEETFERLDLAYDIKELTGNSKDFERVLEQFFDVLPKFNVPEILQRSEQDLMKGLSNVEQWFDLTDRIIRQACDRCQVNCTSPTIAQILLKTRLSLHQFDQRVCKKKWDVGVKTRSVIEVCVFITNILNTNGADCGTVDSQVITPLRRLIEKWKKIRIDVDEMKKNQWKQSQTSNKLFKGHRDFFLTLASAFSQELGAVKLSYLSQADIVSRVQKLLAGKKTSTNLAEIHSLLVVFKDVVESLEKLPNLINRNGKTTINVDVSNSEKLSKILDAILKMMVPELQGICSDRKPSQLVTLTKLVVGVNHQFKTLVTSKSIDHLMLNVQRFGQFAKYLLLTLNKELGGLEGCALQQDKSTNNGTSSNEEEEALLDLKEFLTKVKPLAKRTIKDLANDLHGLIGEYSSDGLQSPVGKLMDLAEDFVNDSPDFKIPVIISFSPNVSTVALNTFQDYVKSSLNILNGMKEIVKKCENSESKCNPQEIFGKSRLGKVFEKFDKYLKSISKYTGKYIKKVKQFPQGLDTLMSALEQVQVSLKTISQSSTADVSTESFDDVIMAFNDVIDSVNIVKKNLRKNFEKLSTSKNENVKQVVENLKSLKRETESLYNSSKIPVLKNRLEGITKLLVELEEPSSPNDISALERRAAIVRKVGKVIAEYGHSFEELYSIKNLPPLVSSQIDNRFAPNVGDLLENTNKVLQDLMKESTEMGQEIGLDLPNFVGDSVTDLPRAISEMRQSAGIRKMNKAKEVSAKSAKLEQFFTRLSDDLKEKYESVMGGISKYKKKYEELKKKMQKYGDIFDEVQETIKELKDKPISRIGEIKDATEDLIDELKNYDLSLIMTADPKTIPNKVSEMRELFTSLSGAFKEMDRIMKKCKKCNVEKVFGYRFLKDSALNIEKAFKYMFEKVEKLADKIGGSIGEVQQMKKTVTDIKDRFAFITDSGKFNLQTLQDLSLALDSSKENISSIQTHAEIMVGILLDRDIDLQVVGKNVHKLVEMLSDVTNKSYVVAQKGKKMYDRALQLQQRFLQLKNKSAGIKSGPLGVRLDIAKSLAEDSKQLLRDLPELFQLSKETLQAAGIDGKWLDTFGENVDGLTNSLYSSLSKTDLVLKAADVTIEGIESIKERLPDMKLRWKEFSTASWDEKIPALQKAFVNTGHVLDLVFDTSIKGANALNYSLTKNDLVSSIQSTLGKERVKKYRNLFGNVSRMLNDLQQGPIGDVGKLTDSVEDFVDALDGYDFGKMLLQNPNDLRNKLTEFQQLAITTGDIIKDIARISGKCQGCDVTNIFGKRFSSSFAEKLKKKFGGIEETFQNITDRVDTGLGGWQKVLDTTRRISSNFDGISKDQFDRQSFDDISEALRKSAVDIVDITNGTSDIFQAVFNGDKDMEFLKGGFESLVHKLSGVLNKTAVILPKAGEVYDSVDKVRDIFGKIGDDIDNVNQGPLESRIEVLKNIGQGVNAIGKTLPLIFDQSNDVLVTLGVNGSWFRRFSGNLWEVSSMLSNVVNKTDTLLNGAGLLVENVDDMRGLTRGIKDDHQKILRAPWNQKINFLSEALGKADKLVQKVSNSAKLFDETIQKVVGVEFGIDDSLSDLTNGVSGVIGNLSEAIKKVSGITIDIKTTIDTIKSGPVEKIGKLTDSTKEFVDNLKNYDLGEILMLSPKFAKEKFGDLKEIVQESGAILKNISGLLKKHCDSCKFDNIFGKNFSSDVLGGIGNSLRNITDKVEKVLDTVEKGGAHAAGIYNSVKGIKSEISKLDGIGFDEDGFSKIGDVLKGTSEYIQDIKNDTSGIFKLLFDGDDELMKVSKRFEGFVNEFGSFIEKAGNFSSNVADAFEEVNKIRATFKETLENIDDLTEGPIENRVKAVQNIVSGVNSVLKSVPDLLKNSPVSPQWLRKFGTKLDGITSGISSVLNKTSEIAGGVGETIENVQQIGETASVIGNEFKRLISAGSVGGKIQVAKNIVGKVSILTKQVNAVVNNVTNVFGKITGKVFKTTDLFGEKTEELLNGISDGLETIADRYTKFTELSKSLSNAFDKLEDDPVKFALEDLPIVFNQTANFVSLIYKDIKGVAEKMGFDLGNYNLDTKLVKSAKSFFKFANTTLGAISSGKDLIDDFNSLLNSKNFKDALKNFDKVVVSGENFMTNVDELGKTLFKNWGNMKDELSETLNNVASSIGVNLKDLGGALSKGLSVGRGVLSIASNIEYLLKIEKWDAETVAQAANSVISIMKSGVDIAKQFGFDAKIPGLENSSEMLGTVTSIINIVRGVKDFTDWLDGACDLTWKSYSVPRNVSYVCYRPKMQIEKHSVLMEMCRDKNITVTRGYGEGKICCPTSDCVYMQDVKCVYQNELCMNNRRLYVKDSASISQSLKKVFLNFDKFSAEARNLELDVLTAQIKLKRSQLKLNRTLAGLIRAENSLKKLLTTKGLLWEQQRRIQSIVYRGQSKITIENVEFEVIQYSPNELNKLPFRITLSGANSEISYLDISIDGTKLQQSIRSIVDVIVDEAVNYISIPNQRRRRRSAPSASLSIAEERRNATYWSHTCGKFNEAFGLIKTILRKLDENVADMKTKQPHQTNGPDVNAPGATTTALLELKKEFELGTMDTIESENEVLERWRRTSEVILTESLGAVCTSFDDCLKEQIEFLKHLYEPTMEGYEAALRSLDNIFAKVQQLSVQNIPKQRIVDIKNVLLDEMKIIDSNTYFCDSEPVLSSLMPLTKKAYHGEYFELKCTIDGPAGTRYSWTRNDTTLPSQKDWVLRILSVSTIDRGTYVCHAKTLTNTVSSNQVLVPVIQPIRFNDQPQDNLVRYPGGAQVEMVCNVTSSTQLSYTWWFSSYSLDNKQLLSRSSILNIHTVRSSNVGLYWCEVSDGQTVLSSRKAKIDIVRIVPRKESARVQLSVATQKKHFQQCLLPSDDSGSVTFEGLFEAKLRNILPTKVLNNLKVTYQVDSVGKAKLNIDLSVGSIVDQSSTKEVGFALKVAFERSKLKSSIDDFANEMKKKAISVSIHNCTYNTKIGELSVDWLKEAEACPRGMEANKDVVYCGKYNHYEFLPSNIE